MDPWRYDFLRVAEERKVLSFGNFQLKSGRISPYFFNAGNFADGAGFQQLCNAYAHAIQNSNIKFDILFGLAYKGIPLVAGTALVLFEKFNVSYPFCYNRKEPKTHGEEGLVVGAKELLKDGARVLVMDDVITAGTALKQSLELLNSLDCKVCGVIIAVDRGERTELIDSEEPMSAIAAFSKKYAFPVVAVICYRDIIQYLKSKIKTENDYYDTIVQAILEYQREYGCQPTN